MALPPNASTCDDTTIDPGGGGPEEGLRVTVVWHRDPQRFGATFWTPWSARAAVVDLGRHEPQFDDGAPLDDHHISRSPLQLVGTPAGLELWPTREGLRFDVGARPGTGGLRIDTATLQRGVRIGRALGVVLAGTVDAYNASGILFEFGFSLASLAILRSLRIAHEL